MKFFQHVHASALKQASSHRKGQLVKSGGVTLGYTPMKNFLTLQI
jgi:hypothetical protein